MDPLELASAIAPLRGDAEIDLVITVGSAAPYVVRCTGGRVTLVETAEPERTVTLAVSESGAAAVRAGTANAQHLLQSGDLRIGGRIDVLQAQAAALATLHSDDAR